MNVQGSFATGIGIKAKLIALDIGRFRFVAVDPGKPLHILCRIEQFRKRDLDVALRLCNIFDIVYCKIIQIGDIDG